MQDAYGYHFGFLICILDQFHVHAIGHVYTAMLSLDPSSHAKVHTGGDAKQCHAECVGGHGGPYLFCGCFGGNVKFCGEGTARTLFDPVLSCVGSPMGTMGSKFEAQISRKCRPSNSWETD